jgi:catechol 2,3-dioxygenase-like lactoylglutathione lyase family enzyme
VTEHLVRCRDFYRRWFGLEVAFEASWFVLLKAAAEGTASIAFMHPAHPSAPSSPEPFNGMCLEFQVVDARAESARFVNGGGRVVGQVSAAGAGRDPIDPIERKRRDARRHRRSDLLIAGGATQRPVRP